MSTQRLQEVQPSSIQTFLIAIVQVFKCLNSKLLIYKELNGRSSADKKYVSKSALSKMIILTELSGRWVPTLADNYV
jgi:hypothetical protein